LRDIERKTGIPRTTAQADIASEFSVYRGQTREFVETTRAIELERTDVMTAGLWPAVEKGDPKAVAAAIRVSERRARLLGLDAPLQSKTEISTTDTMSVARIQAQLRKLSTEAIDPIAAQYQLGFEHLAKGEAMLEAALAECGEDYKNDHWRKVLAEPADWS
jgi:hypothetical protein